MDFAHMIYSTAKGISIFVNKNGTNQGPYSVDNIKSMLTAGQLSMSDYAWHEGCTEWFRLHDKPDIVSMILPPPPTLNPSLPTTTVKGPPPFVPAGQTGLSQPSPVLPPLNSQQSLDTTYAGLDYRFYAGVIDALILIIPILSCETFVNDFFGLTSVTDILLKTFIFWIYFASMTSSYWQATIGMRIVKLKVTDLSGSRLSFARATCRYLASLLSAFFLYIGFIMIPFTPKKQGLHDMIAGTLVFRCPKRKNM